MSFHQPGVVATVYVKTGDPVKVGQVLAVQDDREEKAKLAIIQAEFASAKLQIIAAEKDLKKKKVDLDRSEKLYAELIKQGKTNSEIDEARVNVEIGEIAVKFREGESKQKELEVEAAKVAIDKKKLISPMNGVVAKLDIHAGEGTDLNHPAGLLIVQTSPLWVEANIPSAKAQLLAAWMLKDPANNNKLQVQYVDGGPWMDATLLGMAEVANPGAGVRLVRLQMDNPPKPATGGAQLPKREAGVQVFVRLPEETQKAVEAQAASVR